MLVAASIVAQETPAAALPHYDVLILGGTIYDGRGGSPYGADVAIRGDRIVAVGQFRNATATTTIDASGLAVAPGFINMLSWAADSLLIDGRSQGDIRQGVTLEVFGEGSSFGPLNEEMRTQMRSRQVDYQYEIAWTTLGEYLEHLESKGVSPNIASFVGATTVRVHQLGYANRPPNSRELEAMRDLVRQAMQEGALGLGSALIYAPAFYADTEELVALAKVVGEYGGLYISHIRSEGDRLLESLDELLHIAREGGVAAEIYHLKMSGQDNWRKFDEVVAAVEAARAEGLRITADMYTYTAGSTGLDAAMPPWVQEGGYAAWAKRLQDPAIRAQVVTEMTTPSDEWENLLRHAGATGALLVNFRKPELRKYLGRTLADVASERGSSPQETAIDLVVEDGSRVGVVYFLMSEENVARGVALPWVSFGSDAGSYATEGVFLNQSTHPRAYGNFVRVLGKYVREEKVLSLEKAIYKLSGLPAANLRLRARGQLTEGFYADVVVFDPATVRDHATFDDPHRYATGIQHVFVNGIAVLREGEHTGALPGRVVRGPGWTGWRDGER
jgi:N-acyl-D-amino-acid deacylase